MGKRSKNNRKARRASKFRDHNLSPISHHSRQGHSLIPPFGKLSNMVLSSWTDDHMPEMLWAVLLTESLERADYLKCFRAVAVIARNWFKKPDPPPQAPTGTPEDPNAGTKVVCDLTTLSTISDADFRTFLTPLLRHPLGYAALRPLLLLDALPGIERWRRELAVEPDAADWNTLAQSIAGVFDHQSERSTDIRWFKLMLPLISGWMLFPESMAERLEELRVFPDKGDMRSVRPFIRSGEMSMRRHPPSAWIPAFWDECFKKTQCIDPSTEEKYEFRETTISAASLYACRDALIDHFQRSQTSLRVDPKLDTAFGLVLYGLNLVEEVGMHRAQTRIIGRAALRALVESSITLKYLAKQNKKELWHSYRVYGAGQAKLAFLKAQEAEGDLPAFLEEDALHAIANEDVWQEYLNIDIGHWARSSLRQLAIDADAKDLYDRYYDWTSGYVHGNWGAIRDTTFVSCHNPLHRLHRIPRRMHRFLNSVDADLTSLVNGMVKDLLALYPNEHPIPEVTGLRPTDPPPSTFRPTGSSA